MPLRACRRLGLVCASSFRELSRIVPARHGPGTRDRLTPHVASFRVRKEVSFLEPNRATLVATIAALPSEGFTSVDLEGVEWLEVRADLVGDLDAARLTKAFPGKLLYTLRSRAEGGGFEGSSERRKRRLPDAAK